MATAKRKRATDTPAPMRPQDIKSKPTIERELDKDLVASFPASDPPAMTQPGAGITGPEVKPVKPEKWDREIAEREAGGPQHAEQPGR